MEIIIKKNSSKIIALPVADIEDWGNYLETAVVTFSMLDISTDCYVVANSPADLRLGIDDEQAADNCEVSGVTLFYELSPRQAKNKGVYRGEFRVNFLSSGIDKTLAYPASGYLNITIVDSITTTNKTGVRLGLPVLATPTDTGCCTVQIKTNKLEFEALALSGNLKPGISYAVRMGTDTILVVTAATTHDIMPFGELINRGIPSPDAIKTNIVDDLLTFFVFNGGTEPIIRGGSSRELDFPAEARYNYN